MPDTEGLSAEEFEDFASGINYAIRRLKEDRASADQKLLTNKATSYDDYLQKFFKVQAYNDVIADLEGIIKRRKATL